ncbi:MAG: M2 family metallopeptidase, partial [Bacteroidales bacterium]|nr:M2 family metallopeptidase [Bacteroidales bacterium]
NIINTEDYMNTFLYESGFSAYLKYIDPELPYVLRTPPQFAANDAVATLFSSMSVNPGWLEKVVGISTEEKEKIKVNSMKQLQIEKFVFSRWAQVMYRFEKSLYENPDQNLNKLWWDLVKKYQLIQKPGAERDEPDWATKTHIVTMPCNYHNYMLGELIASQIYSFINMNLLEGNGGCETKCIDNPEIGKYMIDKLFKPGARYTLTDWLKNATGEGLSPEHFTFQYLKLE